MRMTRTFVTKIVFAGLLASLLAASGCFRHTFDNPSYPMEPVPSYAKWHHHFIFGVVSVSPDLNLQAVCPGGVARIENQIGPIGWVITFVTGGIWTPTTVIIWCAASGNPYAVDLATGKVVATVEAPAETMQPAEPVQPAEAR